MSVIYAAVRGTGRRAMNGFAWIYPGGGQPAGWGGTTLIVALIAFPFVVGLIWRAIDAWRNRR